MPFGAPSLAYEPASTGYWSPVTSTINWCEEDYYLTSYVAEAVNSATNLTFVYCAYKGARNCLRFEYGYAFLCAWLMLGAVGIGSTFFHSTLKYEMQLVDELAMIYTTSVVGYASVHGSLSRINAVLCAAALASLSIAITAYYHYLKDPLFHEVMFGIMVVAVVAHGVIVQERQIKARAGPGTMNGNGVHTAAADKSLNSTRAGQQAKAVVSQMRVVAGTSVVSFLVAFALWSADIHLCSTFVSSRHALGLPWGMLLELHAYWYVRYYQLQCSHDRHILTSIGAYFLITWKLWLHLCQRDGPGAYVLSWPFYFSLPELLPTKLVQGSSAIKKVI